MDNGKNSGTQVEGKILEHYHNQISKILKKTLIKEKSSHQLVCATEVSDSTVSLT